MGLSRLQLGRYSNEMDRDQDGVIGFAQLID